MYYHLIIYILILFIIYCIYSTLYLEYFDYSKEFPTNAFYTNNPDYSKIDGISGIGWVL